MSKQTITYIGAKVWPVPHRNERGQFSVKSYLSFQLSRLVNFIKWLVKMCSIAAVAFAILFAVYFYGQFEAGRTISVVNIQAPILAKDVAPILKKIAMAESGGKQFRKDGLPVMHANTNGTVDIGKYQINNNVWGAKAKELGYDILTEDGNEAMATWILENRGTDPWGSSSVHWN